MKMPWKIKGIVLTAPLSHDVDKVVRFIKDYLAPRGFNLIVMQIRYRYQFKNHPEVWGYDPLGYEDVKKLVKVCRDNKINLIPKMNLIGHQSGFPNEPTDGILHGHHEVTVDIRDGLLRAYPELDEQWDKREIYYARSICLSQKASRILIYELISELMDAFESNSIHIGCDEAFDVGTCSVCSQKSKGELIADWVNGINIIVKARGGSVYMWGDRLLSTAETGYDEWEASKNGTESARAIIDKDVIICDWHYNMYEKYPSVDIFGNDGFEIMVCPWRDKTNAEAFLNYAKKGNYKHIKGILMTTWCSSSELAGRLLDKEATKWLHTEQIATTIEELFGDE